MDTDSVAFAGGAALLAPLLADKLGIREAKAVELLQHLLMVLPALSNVDGLLGNVGVERIASYCTDLPGLV
jgi:hypothetical protein